MDINCEYCGGDHEGKYNCPRIEAVEYRKDGSVKRVVLKSTADAAPLPIHIPPYQPTPVTPTRIWIGDPVAPPYTITAKSYTVPYDPNVTVRFHGDVQ